MSLHSPILKADAKHECSSFVCARAALDMTGGVPILFRSYQAPAKQSFNCAIWEAGRATTATRTFFKPITIGGSGTAKPYIDGRFGRYNPIGVVLDEAKLVFPNRQIACIISIGCGNPSMFAVPGPGLFQQRILPSDIRVLMEAMATDCEKTDPETIMKVASTPYFRLAVNQGTRLLGAADWEKLDKLTAQTRWYLELQFVNEMVNKVVKLLQGKHVVSHRCWNCIGQL